MLQYLVHFFEYLRKHSRILDGLYSLDKNLLTVVAQRIVYSNEVNITDPIFDVPWECSSEYQNYIITIVLVASSSSLVPINPRVSIDEF